MLILKLEQHTTRWKWRENRCPEWMLTWVWTIAWNQAGYTIVGDLLPLSTASPCTNPFRIPRVLQPFLGKQKIGRENIISAIERDSNPKGRLHSALIRQRVQTILPERQPAGIKAFRWNTSYSHLSHFPLCLPIKMGDSISVIPFGHSLPGKSGRSPKERLVR